ncbi:hypothetical protein [Allorhizocola rhizosphaerae]|uniref:hypothetical protein n=1 Tax=Allorhizocola rhizosphaerae TaxID=1872709 RepID=UPI0014781229|nr:hypothetical protein [Allorhizocola rhizosphaerae]
MVGEAIERGEDVEGVCGSHGVSLREVGRAAPCGGLTPATNTIVPIRHASRISFKIFKATAIEEPLGLSSMSGVLAGSFYRLLPA